MSAGIICVALMAVGAGTASAAESPGANESVSQAVPAYSIDGGVSADVATDGSAEAPAAMLFGLCNYNGSHPTLQLTSPHTTGVNGQVAVPGGGREKSPPL